MVYREWHEHKFNGVTVYLTNSPSNARYILPDVDTADCNLMRLTKLAGMPYTTVQSRLRRGMSLKDALTPGYAAGYEIPVGDEVYSAKRLSIALGFHEKTIGKRIALGWNFSDLTKPNQRKRLITAFNETKTFSQWCREKGICRGTLAHRLDVLHMTPEAALSLPVDEASSKNAKKQKRIRDGRT